MSAFCFADLTPDTVLDALEELGLAIDSGLTALNSFENRVYQFRGELPGQPTIQRWVVKFYRPQRWSLQQLQEEHDFTRELLAADVPVVAPVSLHGQSVLPYAGGYFALFPSRGGRSLETDNEEQLAQLGRFLGRLHQVGKSKVFQHRPTFSVESHLHQSRQALQQCPQIPPHMQSAFFTALDQVIAEAANQYQPKELIRVHGDCHAGNLFIDQQGPFFVDLDDCRMGPAIQDLWMMLSGERSDQLLYLETMLEEYQQYCDFNPVELKLIEPLRAMRMIHYMAWLARRWDDPAFAMNFPWFATDKYWEQQALVLKEQLFQLRQPPLSLQPGF
ncbi:serine/threonine protein kinase [Alkalimonas amylolytica]|uniref:Stress response kinase A n=1 Tax=Alkalimonas amylolytica TaxID=152573 RepID=A0A1H4DGC3_ALKAM|nr:serine/threonine protein kinase [Alkalimonas amylolytica]SEA71608.1 Ser/Thr protein kinase RdoA involved in Cpx stress response, MazF antagonist [Alkalimonas amylolytica]